MSLQDKSSLHEDLARMDLVSWTFGNFDYDQDKQIYTDPDNPQRSLSASEARVMVRKLIAGFKAKGLQPGDCVCVHAFNDIMYTMLFLAIIGAGGRFTGSNPAFTPSEFAHHIQTTQARFLITESGFLEKLVPTAEASGVRASRTFVMDTTQQDMHQNSNTVQDLLRHGEADWIRFNEEDEAKHTTAALLSTSGTTGLPKAAMISHYNCVMQNIMLQDSEDKTYNISRLITVPEFHAYAFPIAHISPLREGIPTYIMRRFDLHKYLENVDKYQISESPMVPAIMQTILKKWPSSRPSFFGNPLSTLKLVWCAGSPLDERTQDNMYRLLDPSARVVQVWGMTEAGWISTFLWPEKDHTASVGRLLPGMEAKLLSEDGEPVHRASLQNPAEISVRGPTIMQGYLGNSEASSAAIDAEGWLKTGDLGYEEHGKFYIIDRKKEMIKVRGWQVSPAEIESTLRDHPEIVDAAVVGVTTPISTIGESPRAYIVKASDSQVNETDVRTHISQWLSAYKQLNGGIVFLDAVPRTSTGKIDRKAIKERARVEVGEVKEISIRTKVNSAFRTVNKSVQSIPNAAVGRSTPTSSGETEIEQDLCAVSKAMDFSSSPCESSSPSTSESSNDRTSPPSPTVASSVYSDAEEGHTEIVVTKRYEDFDGEHMGDAVAPTKSGEIGIEEMATSMDDQIDCIEIQAANAEVPELKNFVRTKKEGEYLDYDIPTKVNALIVDDGMDGWHGIWFVGIAA